MPSPFPGMNPYLEQDDAWHDFHEKFLPAIAERLVPQVRPNYMTKRPGLGSSYRSRVEFAPKGVPPYAVHNNRRQITPTG
jgi:hypothetical protein